MSSLSISKLAPYLQNNGIITNEIDFLTQFYHRGHLNFDIKRYLFDVLKSSQKKILTENIYYNFIRNDDESIKSTIKKCLLIHERAWKRNEERFFYKWRCAVLNMKIGEKINRNRRKIIPKIRKIKRNTVTGELRYDRLYNEYKCKENYLNALSILYQMKEGELCTFYPRTNKKKSNKNYLEDLINNFSRKVSLKHGYTQSYDNLINVSDSKVSKTDSININSKSKTKTYKKIIPVKIQGHQRNSSCSKIPTSFSRKSNLKSSKVKCSQKYIGDKMSNFGGGNFVCNGACNERSVQNVGYGGITKKPKPFSISNNKNLSHEANGIQLRSDLNPTENLSNSEMQIDSNISMMTDLNNFSSFSTLIPLTSNNKKLAGKRNNNTLNKVSMTQITSIKNGSYLNSLFSNGNNFYKFANLNLNHNSVQDHTNPNPKPDPIKMPYKNKGFSPASNKPPHQIIHTKSNHVDLSQETDKFADKSSLGLVTTGPGSNTTRVPNSNSFTDKGLNKRLFESFKSNFGKKEKNCSSNYNLKKFSNLRSTGKISDFKEFSNCLLPKSKLNTHSKISANNIEKDEIILMDIDLYLRGQGLLNLFLSSLT